MLSSPFSLAGRYARTFYAILPDRMNALRHGKILWRMIEEHHQLKKVMTTALVGDDHKKRVIEHLMDRIGTPPKLQEFVLLLLYKKRFNFFSRILDHVQHLHDQEEGLMTAEVHAAVNLSTQETKDIDNFLTTTYGKKLQTVFILDPSLISGYRIYIGEKVLDASFSTQLRLVERHLKHALL